MSAERRKIGQPFERVYHTVKITILITGSIKRQQVDQIPDLAQIPRLRNIISEKWDNI